MKTDRYNLEDLLADVEHSGRDERRQQELGAMIDRIAAAESGKQRGFWWWSGRVAAAACILFFVSTAVRIWFIPTDGGQPMVAEVKEVPVLPAAVQDTLPMTAPAVSKPMAKARVSKPAASPQKVEEEQPVVVEEYFAEEVEEEEPVENDTTEGPTVIIEDDFAPDTLLAEQAETQAETQQPVAQAPSAPVAKKTESRRSFFSNLLRRSYPSKMDGTMLAFNLL